MKYISIRFLLLVLLSLFITACSAKVTPSENPISTIANNSTDTILSITPLPVTPSHSSNIENTFSLPIEDDISSLALNAYKDVISNKTEFFSTDTNQDIYILEFLSNSGIYDVIFEISQYVILDMDDDSIPEVVLALTVDGYPFAYEILHFMNGAVYGYNIVYRGLLELKSDGVFEFSDGAADNGYGKLIFKQASYDTRVLAYSESSNDNEGMTITYYIEEQSVDEDTYHAFCEQQSSKSDVTWCDFSHEEFEKIS